MKANRAQIVQALKRPGDVRFFLFHGPDEAGSRALVRMLTDGVGADSERIDLSGSDLKADPARLADEAASISLFGGARYIVVEPAGDEILPAVEALLEASGASNPVAIVAGNLRGTSKLLKLALGEPRALAFASYVPDARESESIVLDAGRAFGLQLQPDVARRIAAAAAGNRAVIEQELGKLALYLDAAPERPQPLDHDAIEAVGAANEEGDLSRLVESVASGDLATLQGEIVRLRSVGVDGISLTRALLRRMNLLARLRAEVERGNSVGAVMASQGKAIFFKEKDGIAYQLSRWRSALIAKAIARLLEAEHDAMASGGIGAVAIDEELFAICRQAARLR